MLELTSQQVSQVLEQARQGSMGLKALLWQLGNRHAFSAAAEAALANARLSHSTIRALLVLAAFPEDGSELSLASVAQTLDYSPSTTHRYVTTWLSVGFLEQDARSRRYRRAVARRD